MPFWFGLVVVAIHISTSLWLGVFAVYSGKVEEECWHRGGNISIRDWCLSSTLNVFLHGS